MNTDIIVGYFRIIRPHNLFLITLLTVALQYLTISSLCADFGLSNPMSPIRFLLIMLVILPIATAGYVINDYFDLKIDRINKPSQLVVTKLLSKNQTMILFYINASIGILATLMLAFLEKDITLTIIPLSVTGLLWFYSATYKRQFLIGNFIPPLLIATLPVFLALANASRLANLYPEWISYLPLSHDMFIRMLILSSLIFTLALVCELVKDLISINGDREMECHTLPVVLGEKTTKWIVITLLLALIGLYIGIFLYMTSDTNVLYKVFGILAGVVLWGIASGLMTKAILVSDYKQILYLLYGTAILTIIALTLLPSL